jgi:pimeloyl-ACP methyl ester carboxylesterase
MRDAAEEASISPIYQRGFATSSDGTIIGYRQLGHGPALILVHGGMKSSQDFMQIAAALSDAFTVYLPDRRNARLDPRDWGPL